MLSYYNPVKIIKTKDKESIDSKHDGTTTIKSPLVGTFYSSSKPEEPAFVNIGDRVVKGTTLCIIEAMKIFMNQQVVIPITQARKLVPFDTTYWVGWPTEENNFNHPATWWMSTHQIIPRLRKNHR